MPKLESREEMLKRLRTKMQERQGNKRDPDVFVPPKAKDGEKLEFYFKVLPPLSKGETHKTGVSEKDFDLWFYENGSHFINNERHECPRLHDGEDCPICQLGFKLMEDNDDKIYRSNVAKKYLPRSYYAVNIFFINSDKNPETLRGQVKAFNIPKTVFDVMNDCITNDDVGTEEDPKACGIFYHPTEGMYTFKLVIEHKGEYNTYEKSLFLPTSLGRLIGKLDEPANDNAIQKILNMRHFLPGKFRARDFAKLTALVDKIVSKEGGAAAEEETEEGDVQIEGLEKGGAKKLAAPATKPKVAPESKPAPAKAPKAEVVEELPLEVEEEKQPEKPKPAPAAAKPAVKPAAPKAEAPAAPDDDDGLNDILSKMNDE